MAEISHIKLLCRGVAEWNSQREQHSVVPDLSHVEIRRAVLRGADLRQCDFDGARLSDVDLRDAKLDGARLNGVNVSRTSFLGASVHGVEFLGADCTRVCFRDLTFEATRGFNLKLRHSDLSGVVFGNTELEATHFYNCNLTGTQLQQTSLKDSTAKRITIEPARIPDFEGAGCNVVLPNDSRQDEWVDWDKFEVPRDEEEFGQIVYQGRVYWIAEDRWDFFISHASDDKDSVARPLAEALEKQDQRVWFDEGTVKAADQLDEVIDFGIKSSVFGIVVLSPSFFGRRWTETELSALEHKRLFLVLHNMDATELAKVRPRLAERLALPANLGPSQLADRILEAAQQL